MRWRVHPAQLQAHGYVASRAINYPATKRQKGSAYTAAPNRHWCAVPAVCGCIRKHFLISHPFGWDRGWWSECLRPPRVDGRGAVLCADNEWGGKEGCQRLPFLSMQPVRGSMVGRGKGLNCQFSVRRVVLSYPYVVEVLQNGDGGGMVDRCRWFLLSFPKLT